MRMITTRRMMALPEVRPHVDWVRYYRFSTPSNN
jgi:hypothetical protein